MAQSSVLTSVLISDLTDLSAPIRRYLPSKWDVRVTLPNPKAEKAFPLGALHELHCPYNRI